MGPSTMSKPGISGVGIDCDQSGITEVDSRVVIQWNRQYKTDTPSDRLLTICNSYTMGCPPVRGDNPRALASGLSYVQVDNPCYIYFIPPTSV